MSRGTFHGALLLVLLTSRTVWGRCVDDRALSSDEAVLSVACTEDEAILEWSNGGLAVEYITLEYSCFNHTGNTSSNIPRDGGINPTGTVVDIDSEGNYSSSSAIQVSNWDECTFFGCYEKEGGRSYYFFNPVTCTWPISAESQNTLQTISSQANLTTSSVITQHEGLQSVMSANSSKPSSLPSTIPTGAESQTSLQTISSQANLTTSSVITQHEELQSVTSANSSKPSSLPSTTPAGGPFVNGRSVIHVTVGVTITCVTLIVMVVAALGVCIIVRKMNYRHMNYWKVFLNKDKINADRNFELVSIATPPFMLASTTSLVSEFDKLNCSMTEREGIVTEDEIPLELTKCKQADAYISQFLRPQGKGEYEIPQEYTKSKQPDGYIAQPFKIPTPSTDAEIKTKQSDEPHPAQPFIVPRPPTEVGGYQTESNESHTAEPPTVSPTNDKGKSNDSYNVHPFIISRPLSDDEGKSKLSNNPYIAHPFVLLSDDEASQTKSREPEDSHITLPFGVSGDQTVTDMKKKCSRTECRESDDSYITLPFKVPAFMDTERCHGEYEESNSPYIEEQSGSITVTDNTDSQASANSCSNGYVPHSSAKESTFKHSVGSSYIDFVDIAMQPWTE